MVCDIFDFRCVIVNELVGSVALASILAIMFYFIFAGKIKLGFDTTMYLLLPILLIVGTVISGFAVVYAFGALIVGILLSIIFNRIVGNM